ncbi:DNA primase family protein [Lentibacillus salicampi]|uniref:SF3 helicase domain-containing protein n=1 Tax=Lentibacillus salicampi TaxID=175306 RepID=A0A4Y9ACY3_9BACI|nr:phage/plasmid primase, P4 family [Lentibacillus salicampi]TFJ93646.1 hypothetical protein E4U82_06730 [Lentibacillus salicampi]
MGKPRINPFTNSWEIDDKQITEDEAKQYDYEQYEAELESYQKHMGSKQASTIVSHDEKKKSKINPKDFFSENFKFVPAKLGRYINENMATFYDGNTLYYYKDGVYIPKGEARLNKVIQDILKDDSTISRKRETIDWLRTNNDITYKNVKVNPNDGFINVKNGLLNMETGELLPHSQKRISTIQLPVTYDPDANISKVDKFVKSVVPADTVKLVYEMIGYCLTMDIKAQKAFMFQGSGANGKSVMIDMISALIGNSNISNVALQDLDDNRFKVAQLQHKLINTFDDLPNKALKQNGNFKASVTGGSIDAERKGQNPFQFRPFAKHIYSANTIPKSHDNSDAYFRRWIIIPFPNTFKGENKDESLIGKLTTEKALSTLLNLALEGLQRLRKKKMNFSENESTIEMLKQYINQSDNIVTFVEECCEIGNDENNKPYQVPVENLYHTYKNYCKENNYYSYSKKEFNSHLKQTYNFDTSRPNKFNKKTTWNGIGLSSEYKEYSPFK